MTTLIKNQKRTFRADYTDADGNPCTLIAEVRHDDECRNGHNSFAITGDLYEIHRQSHVPTIKHATTGRTLWLNASGCLHDEIAAHIPELAPFIKWHLCSTDGPMHYLANTIYLAGDRDCWGLRKDEKRQILGGGNPDRPWWELVAVYADGSTKNLRQIEDSYCGPIVAAPIPPVSFRWEPHYKIGEGKARELDAARRAAIWPEATDAELSLPKDELRAKLEARLPALLAEFRAAVESLGLTF